MTQTENALIIFIKNPILGKVKTRLAADLGEQKALDIYIALQEKVRQESVATKASRRLYYSDYVNPKDKWDNQLFSKHQQIDADLGERMHHALSESLQNHQKAVLIGSDIAQISSVILTRAFDLLSECDVVIGPALDGGYYLIGVKQANLAIFENITWSTATVCQDTLENIKQERLTVAVLPALSDIDYAEDWSKYGWELKSTSKIER